YTGATLFRTCTGSSSDWETMEGVEDATGFVSEVRVPAFPELTLMTGVASATCTFSLPSFDVPPLSETASGARFSGCGGAGGLFFAAALSAALVSADLGSGAGFVAALFTGAAGADVEGCPFVPTDPVVVVTGGTAALLGVSCTCWVWACGAGLCIL